LVGAGLEAGGGSAAELAQASVANSTAATQAARAVRRRTKAGADIMSEPDAQPSGDCGQPSRCRAPSPAPSPAPSIETAAPAAYGFNQE
jgi:hypothetical protein